RRAAKSRMSQTGYRRHPSKSRPSRPSRNAKRRLSMTNDLGDRLSALEARVAALEAGKLAPKKPAPRPPVDEGVRITYLTTAPATSLLPTDAQLTELRAIVLAHR